MSEFTLELARLVAPTPETPKTFGKELVNRLCSRKHLDGSELSEFEEGKGRDLCSFLDINDIELGGDLWFLRLFACNSGMQPRNTIDSTDANRRLEGFSAPDATESEREASWKRIKYLCKVANQSESFYRGIYEEQWVRTVSEFFSNYSSDSLVFHSNVVPRQAYFSRMAPCSMNGVFPRQGCNGGFFRIGEGDPRSRQCSGKCDFAKQLKPRVQPVRAAEGMRYSTELPSEDHDVELLPLEENEVEHVSTLASGSQGEVSVMLWRRGVFAIKRFRREGGQANTSFNKELEVAKKLLHPNIVHCFRASEFSSLPEHSPEGDPPKGDPPEGDPPEGDPPEGDPPGYSALAMELLESDLESHLVDLSRTKDQFSFQDSLLVLLQIAEAMKHVHDKNFVHGDLKPGNIFISRLAMPHSYANNRFYLVKVGDFGSTQHVDTADAVQSFQFGIGTYHYKAPEVFKYREQQKKKQELQPVPQLSDLKKIDVYSFGVVAYQVLTGLPTTEIGKGKAWQLEEKKPGEGKARKPKMKRRLLNSLDRFSDHRAPRAFDRVDLMKPDWNWNQWRPSCVVVGDLSDDRASLLPLVTDCWSSSPQKRPDFTKICENIQTIYNQSFPCNSSASQESLEIFPKCCGTCVQDSKEFDFFRL